MSATAYDFPGGDVYQQAQLAANTGYQNAVAKLNQQRTNTLGQYGYLGDVDPTSGALSNVRVDPNNPYGSYQQLLKSSADEAQSLHDNAAGRGLSGGLANQGNTKAAYDYGAGANTLGTNLQNALGGYDTSQVDAENQRDQSVTSAQEQAASSALQWQLQQQQMSALGAAQAAAAASTPGADSGQPATVGGVAAPAQLADIAKQYGLSTTTPMGKVPMPGQAAKTPAINPSLINKYAKLVK